MQQDIESNTRVITARLLSIIVWGLVILLAFCFYSYKLAIVVLAIRLAVSLSIVTSKIENKENE